MTRRQRGHEGPTFTTTEIREETKRIYAAYCYALKLASSWARPPAWEDATATTRKLWLVDIAGVMLGGKSRHPEAWVRELVHAEIHGSGHTPEGN